MLESLVSLIREQAGESVINNPAVPNEQNGAVLQETSASIITGLQQMLAGGQAKEVISMFSNPDGVNESHPAVQQISGGLLESLTSKLGLNKEAAGGIVASLLPIVLTQFASRTASPANNGFSLPDVFSQLSGGQTAGIDIGGLVGKFAQGGMDRDGDGDVDLQDLTAAFSGGGAKSAGGGLLDSLAGMFGSKQ